jgi:2-keto-4-pentenoate hydratase/2-oxohepta-3-ene-1,7-dioic acid hydratase in catechol pathway
LPYLDDAQDRAQGGLDITLEAYIATEAMRRDGMPAHRLTQSSFAQMYWTFAQMIAHHTSNGCNLEIGDLIGSGTVSGPEPSSWASLLELTSGGSKPLSLPSGEQRSFYRKRRRDQLPRLLRQAGPRPDRLWRMPRSGAAGRVNRALPLSEFRARE